MCFQNSGSWAGVSTHVYSMYLLYPIKHMFVNLFIYTFLIPCHLVKRLGDVVCFRSLIHIYIQKHKSFKSGSPGLVPVHGLLGTRPHSRRWAAGERVKLHLYLQRLPIARITAWAPPPVRSVAVLDSHKSANPTVNCACEGSRLHAPYENLMPDDLRWSWGGDASAGERLQIQIIISREVWLCRDHNKSIACRLIKTISVSGKWKQAQGSHWFCIMVSCIITSLYITM